MNEKNKESIHFLLVIQLNLLSFQNINKPYEMKKYIINENALKSIGIFKTSIETIKHNEYVSPLSCKYFLGSFNQNLFFNDIPKIVIETKKISIL